jgi:hypothetical protein
MLKALLSGGDGYDEEMTFLEVSPSSKRLRRVTLIGRTTDKDRGGNATRTYNKKAIIAHLFGCAIKVLPHNEANSWNY